MALRRTLRRTRRRPLAGAVGLLGLLGVLAGCARRTRPESGAKPGDRVTMMVVDNRRPVDFTIFLDRGGHLIRLGMVGGPGVARFNIPADLLETPGALRIIAQGRAERYPLEDQVVARPGDTVRLLIDLNEAQAMVDPR